MARVVEEKLYVPTHAFIHDWIVSIPAFALAKSGPHFTYPGPEERKA